MGSEPPTGQYQMSEMCEKHRNIDIGNNSRWYSIILDGLVAHPLATTGQSPVSRWPVPGSNNRPSEHNAFSALDYASTFFHMIAFSAAISLFLKQHNSMLQG